MLVSLTPVIVGGLIAIFGAIAGTALTHLLRTKSEQKALHKAKLETMVGLLAEVHHWANRARLHHLSDVGEDMHEATPASKILTLAAVHFPNLYELASNLNNAADEYEVLLMTVQRDMLVAGNEAFTATSKRVLAANPADPNAIQQAQIAEKEAKLAAMNKFDPEAYRPVVEARKALLTAAREHAQTL
jgi:hypothetical protein